ncbi:MAG: glycosyltransferase, partial [Solirubrobacterales bacterium]|nr:glycosyltransferase [Solirubrobacterales bacterium]
SVPADAFANWRHAGATRAVLGAAAQIVCCSEFERDLVCRMVPEAAARTQVLPDGVNVAALRAAEPFDIEGTVALVVDRLGDETGVGRAIAAVPSLPPDFQLVVVGDGPARSRLSAFAADLRISSRVRFMGAVSDELLFRWLRTARVVLALSDGRGSGSLVTEARVAGVAVVASDVPAHRQAAGQPGVGPVVFVAPRGSPLDVADAIEEAARLPTSSSAALLASASPSWESVIDATWRLYARLVGDRVDAEPTTAANASEVVDLTAQLRAGRQSRTEPVISGAAQSGADQDNGRSRWQGRRRVEGRTNGARRWP